jgi:hypothetical protein
VGAKQKEADTVETESPSEGKKENDRVLSEQFSISSEPASGPAWEEVAAGRYMPRRIKGSCKGRALG